MVAGSQKLTSEQRKERKRSQNRLNQRVHRHRVRERQEANGGTRKLPYQVNRWRLGQCPGPATEVARPLTSRSRKTASDEQVVRHDNGRVMESDALSIDEISNQEHLALGSGRTIDFKLHLPPDHVLINLINHNICRGFMSNKSLLNLTTIQLNIHKPVGCSAPCEIAVIRPTQSPTQSTMPICLLPTQLQMNSPHPTWIDALPFPAMRDNLIKQQRFFHHVKFLEDLIGDFGHVVPPCEPHENNLDLIVSPRVFEGDEEQQTAYNSKGLILWGEPHLKESWEATPRFLRDWSWAVEGCHELVEISNGWRITRGEDPIQMSLQTGG